MFASTSLALLVPWVLTPDAAAQVPTAASDFHAPQFDLAGALARANDSPSPCAAPIFDQAGDGAIWVHTATFKAKFDRAGFEYIPFLGSDAPKDYPIDFTIESARVGPTELAWQAAVQPELDGETVTFHRGAFDEVYVVGLDSIEQNFVVLERHTAGDLHVVVHTETELERADDAAGTVFGNEVGGAHVGKASIRDARGSAVHSLTRLAGESIEIVVPRSQLEAASFPLAIDPLITTWTVTLVSAPTSNYPDTSYDWWTDSWLCVNQETFSATDHDIIARQFTSGGTLLNQTFIDFTVDDWTRPRVANNKAQHVFMVVAEVGANTTSGSVEARIYNAATRSVGTAFAISPGVSGHQYWCPDIGGDSSPVGTRPFCVAYLQSPSDENNDPLAADYTLVSPMGTVISRSVLGGAAHEPIKISKSNGTPASDAQRWTIAWPKFWTVDFRTFFEQVDSYGARFPSSPGELCVEAAPGYNTLSVSPLVDGTTFPREFAVGVYTRGDAFIGAHTELNIQVMDSSGMPVWTAGGSYDYYASDLQDQVSVETDGTDIYFVGTKPISGPHGLTQHNIYLTTVHAPMSGGLTTLQSFVLIAGSTDDESMPSLASMHSSGGGSSNMLCVYKRIATIGGAASILAAMLY